MSCPRRVLVAVCAIAAAAIAPQATLAAPELTTWKLNTTGATGYGGLPADVQQVRYSATNVYVNSSCIPDYAIGPWPGNPNVPTNQNFLIRIPRQPVENTGTKTSTPLGTIGIWKNGVAVFNALDARSYNNANIWHQNAITVEGPSFDACLGHPAPGGVYHHHENASCLYGADTTQHSAILGYAYDGFPIYGPYAFADAQDTSGTIRHMRSSWQLRSITQRHTLADGTVLSQSQWGPDVSAQYPLGYYVEDYQYVAGSGDLDQYNGRFAVTPEYGSGTYAYYTTVDGNGVAVYPYHVGPQYYGVVATDDISSHGHVTISEAVSRYDPLLWVPVPARGGAWLDASRPNPAIGRSTIAFTLAATGRVRLTLHDVTGRAVRTLLDETRAAGAQSITFDTAGLEPGVYWYRLQAGRYSESRHLLVSH